MSTVIFSLSILILLALIVYAVRKRGQHSFLPETEQAELQSPRFSALFAPTKTDLARAEQLKHHLTLEDRREKLLTWATLVDFSAINNRPLLEDKNLWADAIEILTERAHSDEDIRALIAFCLDNEFYVNDGLINAFQKIWEGAPDYRTTTEMFRLAVKNNDAQMLLDVLIEAERFVKTGELSDLSAVEIHELAENNYWQLSHAARNSGAGFPLRQKLADLRTEAVKG